MNVILGNPSNMNEKNNENWEREREKNDIQYLHAAFRGSAEKPKSQEPRLENCRIQNLAAEIKKKRTFICTMRHPTFTKPHVE